MMSKFQRFFLCMLSMVAGVLLFSQCSTMSKLGLGSQKVVVLDIGHFEGGPGARTPSSINGKSITEHEFWYQYAYYTKKAIEDAGYKCIVTNRGKKPTRAHMLAYAKQTHVVHIGKPDETSRGSYASKYHPDRVANGIVSADYAIYRGADCVVFLHHNSYGRGWRSGGSPSLLLYNRVNGKLLADTIGDYMEKDILNQSGGMYNAGMGIKSVPRYGDAQSASGWLNALDDSGIPGVVIEVAFLNNRNHAQFLAEHKNAIKYAESVGEGVVTYMDKYGNLPGKKRVNPNVADAGSFGQARSNKNRHVPGAVKL